jgi:uncharacterized membrane protein
MAIEVAPPQTGEPMVVARSASRSTALAKWHLMVGGATLTVFLISGVYMRWHDPAVGALEPGLHVMFTSRHIYILAAALIHLVLGAYVRPAATGRASAVQRAGSLLLVVAAGLLMAAFVVEPMAGRYRTSVSSFGLYSLFAGTLMHVGAALCRRGA